ncbi:MAG: hypothetical protein AAF702_32985 [Chloroflexota bacterium]
MAKIEIDNLDKEELFEQYRKARQAPIETMRYGVIPNILKFKREAETFLSALSDGGDLADYKEFTGDIGLTLIQKAPEIIAAFDAVIAQLKPLDQARIANGKPQFFGTIEG